jgi:hypothetical protein
VEIRIDVISDPLPPLSRPTNGAGPIDLRVPADRAVRKFERRASVV